MNIQNFNKKLNKINAMSDSGMTEGDISSLERDLLLSYIRDLYEIVLDDKKNEIQAKQTVTKSIAVAPAIKIEKVVQPQVEPIVEPSKMEEVIEEKIVEVEKVRETIQPIVSIKTASANVANQNTEALDEMFADDKITDLSDKLALTPVKDLTKSMGINERIFTQQELFGNDNEVFNSTLQNLNNCQNFDEAKQYLFDNVIYKFDWVSEKKLKKASTFVKLVKRKFS